MSKSMATEYARIEQLASTPDGDGKSNTVILHDPAQQIIVVREARMFVVANHMDQDFKKGGMRYTYHASTHWAQPLYVSSRELETAYGFGKDEPATISYGSGGTVDCTPEQLARVMAVIWADVEKVLAA